MITMREQVYLGLIRHYPGRADLSLITNGQNTVLVGRPLLKDAAFSSLKSA